MPTRSPGLTEAEHHKLALEIELARRPILDAYIKLGHSDPLASSQVKLAKRSEEVIGRLKSSMDDIVCDQFPEDSQVRATHIYYGLEEATSALLQRIRET